MASFAWEGEARALMAERLKQEQRALRGQLAARGAAVAEAEKRFRQLEGVMRRVAGRRAGAGGDFTIPARPAPA